MEKPSDETANAPKVFISYSWTTQTHQDRVLDWAERLRADGVDVVLDLYDFKEGHDKFAFMERMVNDPGVTHVLIFSDKMYASKADSRRSGVGTESQIISKEVYESVQQSKFIPIVCEFVADTHEACLPTFLKSRKWIDFSTPELVNNNWERLIRLLFGKPTRNQHWVNHPRMFGNPVIYRQVRPQQSLALCSRPFCRENRGSKHIAAISLILAFNTLTHSASEAVQKPSPSAKRS